MDHSSSPYPGAPVLIGTTRDDTLHGGGGVADIRGWAGDDVLSGGIRGGSVAGGHGNDVIFTYGFGSTRPEQFQTHAFGDWGNDTFYLDLSRHPGDTFEFRFGHHVFGGQGADKFCFSNLGGGNQRIIGRIDDFDASQDSIWINNARIDLNNLPENVRLVEHLGQKWILINNRALFALEGARHKSPTIDGDGRNSEASEENHFIYWPEEWRDGVPASADVAYVDPVNFVPLRFLPENRLYDHIFKPQDYNFTGTDLADRIEGSPDHGQIISSGSGNDFAFGNRGDDTLMGGSGHDQLDGYHGHDELHGGAGHDIIDGGKGHDRIFGGHGNDVIAGGSDNDTVHGGNGKDIIFGGTEQDLLRGEAADDVLHGGDGNDSLYGGVGHDKLHGNSGDDVLWGDDGDDKLLGDDGDDALYGASDNDSLWGAAGNDKLYGGAGEDWLHGGYGWDSISGSIGNDTILGHGGNDRLSGGTGSDRIHGGAGADLLQGSGGNDQLLGDGGNDRLYGGTGRDLINGGVGSDRLSGGLGNDTIRGGSGNDVISGGGGADQLFGGSGHDNFVFTSHVDSRPGASIDMIRDFTAGEDKLDLSALDADLGRLGNQTLRFSSSGPADNAIWAASGRAGTYVRADLDGDGQQDFAFLVADVEHLQKADFIL